MTERGSPGAQHEGLKVADVVVLIDREQGGAARMASNGLRLHSAFTLSFILGVLRRHGLVCEQVAADVQAFIADNQTFDASAPKPAAAPTRPKRYALLLAVVFTVHREVNIRELGKLGIIVLPRAL